jgi:anti-sigma B factor antagonist
MAGESGNLIHAREEGAAGVFSIGVPRVSDADTIERLGHEIRRAIAASAKSFFVLDLGGVEFLTSAALGLIINIHANLIERGCSFALAAPQGEVARVLRQTRLDKILRVCPSVQEAVRDFCSR